MTLRYNKRQASPDDTWHLPENFGDKYHRDAAIRSVSRLGDVYVLYDRQDGAPRKIPSVPRAIDLRMSVVRIANGGTLLLFMAFYDLSLYISDYVEFFRDPCRALCAESEIRAARCVSD